VGGAGYLVRADRAVLVHLCVPMAVGRMFGTGGGALVSRRLGAAENEPAMAGEMTPQEMIFRCGTWFP
jgi:hypothetical protein